MRPVTRCIRLYGHTALRVRNVARPTSDYTYNFGWFSFDTPNFVMRFVLGRTDYSMAKESTALFVQSYLQDDAQVTAQVLALTPEEAHDVAQALNAIVEQHDPEVREYVVPGLNGEQDRLTLEMPHWTYRYNFLYDNCTTRALAAVQSALAKHGERLVFPDLKNDGALLTQRRMIHEFTAQSPWYEFGQDLLLGPEVDREFPRKDLPKMNFLPIYAKQMWQAAKVQSADGKLRSLVVVDSPLIPFSSSAAAGRSPLTPGVVFWGVFVLAALLTLGEQRSLERTQVTRRAWRIWIGTLTRCSSSPRGWSASYSPYWSVGRNIRPSAPTGYSDSFALCGYFILSAILSPCVAAPAITQHGRSSSELRSISWPGRPDCSGFRLPRFLWH